MKRSLNFIANFENGFAKGWEWAVPLAFQDALDIKPTKRIINKKTVSLLTQGNEFYFGTGDILYEGKEAHSMSWIKYLKTGKRYLQIKSAGPSFSNEAGFVEFLLYQPCYPLIFNSTNPSDTETCTAKIIFVTQHQFINFLKFGYLPDNNEQLLLTDKSCPFSQIEGMQINLFSIPSKKVTVNDY